MDETVSWDGSAAVRCIPTAPVRKSKARTRALGGGWASAYQRGLVAADFLSAIAAIALAWLLRFPGLSGFDVVDITFAVSLPFTWVAAIGANRAYQRRFVGVGNAEFDRVFRAFLHLSVVWGLLFYALQAPVARGFALPALGFALVINLLARVAARKVLHHRRRRGRAMTDVIAVGTRSSVAPFATMLRRDQYAGMRVVGVCLADGAPGAGSEIAVPSPDESDRHADNRRDALPVLGGIGDIRSAIAASKAHTVAVLAGDVDSDRLRWISWQLEGTGADLVVSPGLADFGGGRLHIQPVAGLPLLHVEQPKFSGLGRATKELFDRAVAATALVLLSPLLLAIAIAVRTTTSGPVLFRQTRVGRNGREFTMIKFRSMVANAESLRLSLSEVNEHDGLLFKIRADPRVTPVGRVLRRFSLDELPQLLNVLGGSMSLVGPRPPLPDEVAEYGDDVRRRLLVKPGLTGLWQVSGRSDLNWDESVRLDLRYVEDWSLSLDMIVLWKTARAVLKADGAY